MKSCASFCIFLILCSGFLAAPQPRQKRYASNNATLNSYGRWDDATVPYVFAPGHHTAAQKRVILSSMKEISCKTPIKFSARTNQVHYLNILNDATAPIGCSSSVGRIGGAQPLNLDNGRGCVTKAIAIRTLVRAIGVVPKNELSELPTTGVIGVISGLSQSDVDIINGIYSLPGPLSPLFRNFTTTTTTESYSDEYYYYYDDTDEP